MIHWSNRANLTLRNITQEWVMTSVWHDSYTLDPRTHVMNPESHADSFKSHCNTLQQLQLTEARHNTLQHTEHNSAYSHEPTEQLWLATTQCNTAQHSAPQCNILPRIHGTTEQLWLATTQCNKVQHSATQCTTVQHTSTDPRTHRTTLTRHNTVQHTPTNLQSNSDSLQRPCFIHKWWHTLSREVFATSHDTDRLHSNTMQHHTLQHTAALHAATHCNEPHTMAACATSHYMDRLDCNTLQQHTLQHIATHCNTL